MGVLAVLVALVALIVGGFYTWARKRGLTTAGSVGSVNSAGSVAPNVSGAARFSMLTESAAYIGAILVLAGGIAAIGQRWSDIPAWGRVGVFAGASAFFLAVGVIALGVREPPAQRVVGAVWFVSVIAAAGAAGSLAQDVYSASDEVTALLVALTVSAYSAVLWWIRKHALLNVALFAGLIATIADVINSLADGSVPTLAYVLALWAFGVLWAVLGWRRYVEPIWVTLPLGVLLALAMPSFAVTDHGWVYAIGVLTAAAVMAASVPLRNTALLAIGTLWMFAYVTSIVVRYFADSLGAPVALVLTGALILVLTVIGARLMRATRPPRPEQPASVAGSPGQDRPEIR